MIKPQTVRLQQLFNLGIIWSCVKCHSLCSWRGIKEQGGCVMHADLRNLHCWKPLPSAIWSDCSRRVDAGQRPMGRSRRRIPNSGDEVWPRCTNCCTENAWRGGRFLGKMEHLRSGSSETFFHLGVVLKACKRRTPNNSFTLCISFNAGWIRTFSQGRFHVSEHYLSVYEGIGIVRF